MPTINQNTFENQLANDIETKIQIYLAQARGGFRTTIADVDIDESAVNQHKKLQLDIFAELDKLMRASINDFITILTTTEINPQYPNDTRNYDELLGEYILQNPLRLTFFLSHANLKYIVILTKKVLNELFFHHKTYSPIDLQNFAETMQILIEHTKTVLKANKPETQKEADALCLEMITYLSSAQRFDITYTECLFIFISEISVAAATENNSYLFYILVDISTNPQFMQAAKDLTYKLIDNGVSVLTTKKENDKAAGTKDLPEFCASFTDAHYYCRIFCNSHIETQALIMHAIAKNRGLFTQTILEHALATAIAHGGVGMIRAAFELLSTNQHWDKMKPLGVISNRETYETNSMIQGILTYLTLINKSIYDLLSRVEMLNSRKINNKKIIKRFLGDIDYYVHEAKPDTRGAFLYLAENPELTLSVRDHLPSYLHPRFKLPIEDKKQSYFVLDGPNVDKLFIKPDHAISPLHVAVDRNNIAFIRFILSVVHAQVRINSKFENILQQEILRLAQKSSELNPTEFAALLDDLKIYRKESSGREYWFDSSLAARILRELDARKAADAAKEHKATGLLWGSCYQNEDMQSEQVPQDQQCERQRVAEAYVYGLMPYLP